MNNDWLILIILSGCFLVLFIIAELLHIVFKIQAEYTRKIVHIVTGLLTLLFPVYLSHIWQVAVICSAFLLLLLLSKKYNFLRSINAIDRPSYGSILYPLVVIAIFSFYRFMEGKASTLHPYAYFYIPVLIMAVCDPVAAIAGNAWKSRHPGSSGKTIAGTVAFGIVAFILSFSLLNVFSESELSFFSLVIAALLLAFSCALTERYTGGGWDNFTIPVVAAGILYLLTYFVV